MALTKAVSGLEVTCADRTTLLPIKHIRPCNCYAVKHQTSSLRFWPVNSPDISPVDYRIWKLQERVYGSRIHDVAQLKSHFIEEWYHFNQMIN